MLIIQLQCFINSRMWQNKQSITVRSLKYTHLILVTCCECALTSTHASVLHCWTSWHKAVMMTAKLHSVCTRRDTARRYVGLPLSCWCYVSHYLWKWLSFRSFSKTAQTTGRWRTLNQRGDRKRVRDCGVMQIMQMVLTNIPTVFVIKQNRHCTSNTIAPCLLSNVTDIYNTQLLHEEYNSCNVENADFDPWPEPSIHRTSLCLH